MSQSCKLFLIGFFLCLFRSGYGQTLLGGNHQLNSGGAVYDVDFDPDSKEYIIVGSFTTVGSGVSAVPRAHLAILDSATLSVKDGADDNIIASIDGNINAVAYHPGTGRLFIGGDFDHVNSQPREGFAMFVKIGSSFILHSYDPFPCTAVSVNTLELYNDTLFIGGEFAQFTGCDFREGFAAVRLNTAVPTTLNFGGGYSSTGGMATVYSIKKKGAFVYVAGRNMEITDPVSGITTSAERTALLKLTTSGAIVSAFNPDWTPTGVGYSAYDIEFSPYGIYLSAGAHMGTPEITRLNLTTGAQLPVNVSNPNNTPVYQGPRHIEYHHKKIYAGNNTGITASPYFGWRWILSDNPFWSSSMNTPLNNGTVKRIGTRMFVSDDNLTSIMGQSRTGLAVFCVEPPDPTAFTAGDVTVCPGAGGIYTIQQVPGAAQYNWFYTGSGATIESVLNNYTGNFTKYTVSVQFSDDFTPGNLCVVPMSDCGMRADTLELAITRNPVPNVSNVPDTVLTCKNPVVTFTGSSTTPGATYQWTGPSSYAVTGATATAASTGNYIFIVTDPITTCTNKDTVVVTYDTTKPNVTLPPPPYQLTCSDSLVTLDGSSSSVRPTILEWRKVSTNVLFPDPYNADAPGQYRLIVTDTVNGCPDSLGLIVSLYQPQPNLQLSGYASILSSVPQDTITCYTPAILLEGYSDTLNTTVYFTDSTHTLNYGDSVVVDSAGFYYLYAINSITGCANSTGFYIAGFTNPPDLNVPASASLSCSVDSVTLDASTVLTGASIVWNGGPFSNAPDPITVNAPGTYIATNMRSDNGCTRTDTVVVGFNPNLIVFAGNDTVVCEGSSLVLNVSVDGPGLFTYNWSNGPTTSANSIIVTGEQSYTVHVDDGAGCTGDDTVVVSVPDVPLDSIVAFRPCSGDSSGQIVVHLTGGLAPYTYSINGTSYQSLNQFTGLPNGTYTIYVNDALGCNYTYPATISSSSALPEPMFLNATYNFLGDTIALVDVSSPIPDSIQWLIPPAFTLIQDGNPAMIIANDTGNFTIGLRAYYSGCEVDKNKTIYIRIYDSTLANALNQNGIKRLELFPNPNTGSFTVELEFYKKQDYVLGIYDITSTAWFSDHQLQSTGSVYSVNLPAGATNGTYVLRVVSEFDSRALNFIISR